MIWSRPSSGVSLRIGSPPIARTNNKISAIVSTKSIGHLQQNDSRLWGRSCALASTCGPVFRSWPSISMLVWSLSLLVAFVPSKSTLVYGFSTVGTVPLCEGAVPPPFPSIVGSSSCVMTTQRHQCTNTCVRYKPEGPKPHVTLGRCIALPSLHYVTLGKTTYL